MLQPAPGSEAEQVSHARGDSAVQAVLSKYRTLQGILYMRVNKRMTLELCFRKWLMFDNVPFFPNICGLQFILAESQHEEFCMFVSRTWSRFALGRSKVEFNGVICHGSACAIYLLVMCYQK